MSWQSIYQEKITTARDAIRAVKSGDRVFLTGNCSIPKILLEALVDYAPEVEDVEITHALTLGSSDYVAEGMEDHVRVNTMFIGANVRQAVQEGRADFTPVLLSEFTLLFKRPTSTAFAALAWKAASPRRRPSQPASSSPR
jgi:acetyl-CoA hydrolase